jgi:hypothetical protein
VAEPPDGIDTTRHGERMGAGVTVWSQRAFIAILTAFVALGLVGVFGQRSATSTAASPAATLDVEAPTRVRGGLFYQGRFTIRAHTTLRHATLVLERGWTEQMHINTIAPAPASEGSRDGLLALNFGPLERGQRLVAYLQFQVNPASAGRRPQNVTLTDGDRVLASIERTVVVFP